MLQVDLYFFSLCGWNYWYAPVGYTLGNSWRVDGDGDNWGYLTAAINAMAYLTPYSSPGGRNDPDLLIGTGVGSYGPDRGGWYQTDLQSRSQFSMWCVFSAPLLISADILSVSAYGFETWSNSEAIAVNQNPGNHPAFSYQGFRITGTNLTENSGTNIWGRALDDGSFGVVFLNNYPNAMDITCDQSCFNQMKYVAGSKLEARDLWTHTSVNITVGSFTASAVPGAGGCAMYRFFPIN